MKILQYQVDNFKKHLALEEKTNATIQKYIRDVQRFRNYLAEKELSKEVVVAYKQYLLDEGYAARSINSMIASLNAFLRYIGHEEFKVKQLRIQREIFCPEEKELSRDEYLRLLRVSCDDPQINLIMQTICSTGIRVSELRFFTVENMRREAITVECKSKRRVIFLPSKLREKLRKYASNKKIKTGCIFQTKKGTPIDRSAIWAKMKKLCVKAGINPKKVFPHNLRKLFARTFYRMEKDIAKLADILGHSNIETTRIYIMTSSYEYSKKVNGLRLII